MPRRDVRSAPNTCSTPRAACDHLTTGGHMVHIPNKVHDKRRHWSLGYLLYEGHAIGANVNELDAPVKTAAQMLATGMRMHTSHCKRAAHLRRALLLDAALVEDHYVIGNVPCLLLVVGDDDGGHPHPLHNLPQALAAEPDGGRAGSCE